MKQIESVIIRNDCQEKTANILTAKIVEDNLKSLVTFITRNRNRFT